MWKTATKVVQTLETANHTAYFAGGAVRDLLLSRKISDIDIATSATPDEVASIFKKTHPIGKDFGVTLVLAGRHAFEVATFRSESDYDGRRPGQVSFTSAEKDAQRRDFTVNGLFYDPLTKKVLDFVNGQHDLKLKVIRFIGKAEERVQEDHLRLLRAVRFRNALGFEYEPKTARAVEQHAHLIEKISAERISTELTKMLVDPSRTNAVRDLDRFGLLAILLPELVKLKGLAQPTQYHKEGDAFTHSLGSLATLPVNTTATVAWATLLHDIGKAETYHERRHHEVMPRSKFPQERDQFSPEAKGRTGEENQGQAPDFLHHERDGIISFPGHAQASAKLADRILKRLKMDNATRAKITWLIHEHMTLGDFTKMRQARRHRYFTHPWFGDLLKVCKADIHGTRPANECLLREVRHLWKTETEEELLPMPQELLTGSEIMHELKVAAGPEIGRLKRVLYDAQVEGLVQDRKEAITFLEKCLKR